MDLENISYLKLKDATFINIEKYNVIKNENEELILNIHNLNIENDNLYLKNKKMKNINKKQKKKLDEENIQIEELKEENNNLILNHQIDLDNLEKKNKKKILLIEKIDSLLKINDHLEKMKNIYGDEVIRYISLNDEKNKNKILLIEKIDSLLKINDEKNKQIYKLNVEKNLLTNALQEKKI